MSRILLIEDEPWLGELYCLLLARAGQVVDWCRDGHEAIGQLDRAQPDMIVLDLLLPWGNGLQLLHELASHADLTTVPVILCSNALPGALDDEVLRHYGVVGKIDKASTSPHTFVRTVIGVANAAVSH